jgi:sarcosine oxidase
MARTCDVAIIGLGAMGSAAAYHLARRGKRVIAVERFEPGHDRGSSHGESRIIRLAYFEHPSYVPLLRRAYENWRALERDTGARLLTITGILEAGHPDSSVVRGSLEASRLHDLPHEVLDGAAISRRFPAFRVPAHWHGVFQPDGGFLRPELAIRVHVDAARAHGAEIRIGVRVLGIDAPGGGESGVRIRTANGTIEAGSAVIAAGAWIAEFLPLLRPHLRITRQVLGWFAPHEPDLFAPERCPVFLLESEEDACYGFPNFAGTGVKVASHREGRALPDGDALAQDGDAEDEARIRRTLARYIPAADGPLRQMRTCMYTRTPDEDFAVDLHPDDPRLVIASPCSGHGFKFASVMGEILADLSTEGTTRFDISRFRLGRLAAR